MVQAGGGGVFPQDSKQGTSEPFVDGKAEAAFGAGEQFGREVAVEECAEGGFTLAEPGVADAVAGCEIENPFVEERAADFEATGHRGAVHFGEDGAFEVCREIGLREAVLQR